MSTTPTMRALTVTSWGKTPILSSLPKPSTPSRGQTQIHLIASGLPVLVRSQASGTHYTTSSAPLPYTPGIDGVGYTSEHKLVYVNLLTNKPAPGGAFAEYVNVDDHAITPVSVSSTATEEEKHGVAVKIAGLINPALSSWMALKYRAHITNFTTTFNVLILGATSTSGRIAGLFARHLGAASVIGVARNTAELEKMKSRGQIDHAISLDKEDVNKTDFSLVASGTVHPHIVLDYIYGSTAMAVLNALPHSARSSEEYETRYIHIGTLGREPEVALSGPLLRSKNVSISGSGPGSWSVKALMRETPELVKAIAEVLPNEGWQAEYGVVERKLEDVETAWADKDGRTVFVLD